MIFIPFWLYHLHIVYYEYENNELLPLSGIAEHPFHLLKARRSLKTCKMYTDEYGINVNLDLSGIKKMGKADVYHIPENAFNMVPWVTDLHRQ
jgi:hypothetical protein